MSVALLESAATALGELCGRVVFLGGATIGVWMTDPTARAPRVTYDVDVVAEVMTLAEYETFQAELRLRGFAEDVESGVIGRWRRVDSPLVLDAIPLAARFAGLGGRWLRPAVAAAVAHQLPSGAIIRLVPPAHLLATKLEAFADRGGQDCLASRDFEDVVLLVDSRQELVGEIAAASPELREYVQAELRRIMALPAFEYGMDGALIGPDAGARGEAVTLPRLQQLSQLAAGG